MLLLTEPIISLFALDTEAASIVRLFCWGISMSYLFVGMVIVVNAILNNIGYAKMSTVINFAKATLFTLPFVIVGGLLAEGKGILVAQALGNVCIGLIAWLYCAWVLKKLAKTDSQQ